MHLLLSQVRSLQCGQESTSGLDYFKWKLFKCTIYYPPACNINPISYLIEMSVLYHMSAIESYQQGWAPVLLWISESGLATSASNTNQRSHPNATKRWGVATVTQCHTEKHSEAVMSRHVLSHERFGGLIPHAHPLLPLSWACIPLSSLLAQDNYQPALLPKRVIGGKRFPVRLQQPGSEGGTPMIGHADP